MKARRIRNAVVTLGLAGFLLLHPHAVADAPEPPASPPNILFILADDLGYGDIEAYAPKSRIPTPHLNRLAAEGMRFTDAHSGSSVCTPTRYGLITGRYAWRTRLKSGVLFPPGDRPLIERDRLTVARLLGRQGYHTTCIGKWHLGIEWARDAAGEVDFNLPIRFGPTDVGFDAFFGIAASLDMVPYGFYRDHDPVAAFTGEQPAQGFPRYVRRGPKAADFDPGAVLERLADEAIDCLRQRAVAGDPFFLYLALTAPHKPVWPAERFRGTTALGPYGDFVHQTDAAVGRVLGALDVAGLRETTLVIFSSDNGSYMYRWPNDQPDHVQDASVQGFWPARHQANGSWRGTKADVWEAGHRVPFLVRWPGEVRPGSRCDATVCLVDFVATCAEITGVALPPNTGEDSFSLLSLFRGKEPTRPRAPVVNHSANGMFALRDGRWKMVFGNGSGGREKPAGRPFQEPYALFDLDHDPGETANVLPQHPEIGNRLTASLGAIRSSPGSRVELLRRPTAP